MKVRAKWVDGVMFVGESASGHGVVMDGSPDVGGRNLGIRPMEMLLLGLAGCTAIDVLLILQKARQDIRDCWVEVEAERAAGHPKIFTAIHAHFVIIGNNIAPARVEQAAKLSAEKYCSASAMLAATAKLTHDFEIREAAA